MACSRSRLSLVLCFVFAVVSPAFVGHFAIDQYSPIAFACALVPWASPVGSLSVKATFCLSLCSRSPVLGFLITSASRCLCVGLVPLSELHTLCWLPSFLLASVCVRPCLLVRRAPPSTSTHYCRAPLCVLSRSRWLSVVLLPGGHRAPTVPTFLLGPPLPSHLHALFSSCPPCAFGYAPVIRALFLVALGALRWCTAPCCAHYSAVCASRCAFVSLASRAPAFALVLRVRLLRLKFAHPLWVVCLLFLIAVRSRAP